jgi:hypothetical protein
MIKIKEKTVIEISKIKSGLNEDFESIKWLLKARQPDRIDWKPIFSKVYADKKRLVCTDAKRMHLINNSFEINPGLYDVLVSDNKKIILSQSDCEDKFPDYKSLIKNDEILTEIIQTSIGLTDRTLPRLYQNFYQKVGNKNISFGFDMNFMKQAFRSDTSMSVLIKIVEGNYSGTDPIRIQDNEENHVAVIMPILLKEYQK